VDKDKERFRIIHSADFEDDEEEYNDMELLERLESLREDMEELGVSSLADVERRIEELHHKLEHHF
jgi:hypothetical protein